MSTSTGQLAETLAAEWLKTQGYEIIDRNWRTRWCEIDIIASRGDTIYFVEVKYRRQTNSGQGMDYITPKKLQQMGFAAEFYISQLESAQDYELSAIAISGQPPKVDDFIPQIT